MPKGFLVKRSKRTGAVSYRIRDDSEPAQSLPSVTGISTFHLFRDNVQACSFAQRTPNRVCFGGMPESFYAPSLSPTRPDSSEYNNQYPTDTEPLCSTVSPSLTEIFPEPILGSFAVNGSPATPSLPEMTSKLDSICKEQARAAAKRPASTSAKNLTGGKKRKATSSPNQDKRPVSRDEVTTSPVLGLRIKEDPDEDTKKSTNTNSSPLSGFVCQLCKESYSDPLSLAHHKCSRIVRVEYRCNECDKVFSCPANLASHRRWHKPRGAQGGRVSPQPEENKSSPSASSHGTNYRESATPPPHNSDSASDDEMTFSCHLCAKKFRRQAYLRKHLALHNRKASGLPQNQLSPEATVTAQSPTGQGKERDTPDGSVQHPTNEPTSVHEGGVYNCRFCGDNFFSSPGLTRHINKFHPTEKRQVIFLSRTV
ncbi:insulinoma-associated protein 1a-like [Alosa sapidissima]|uniref:insulinoma-associated protein 1a-like n=1 Tax=Alosa sapidissima TaxID=34773 RepID=UPI001C0891E2|nr:insulinoma-associated protein 1a-like [Alosa sapidissima]